MNISKKVKQLCQASNPVPTKQCYKKPRQVKCFLLLLSLILVHNLFVNVAFLFFIISSLCLGLPNFGQLKAKGGLFWNYHIFANLFIASISKMSKGLAAFIQLVKVRRVAWFWHFWAYNFHKPFTRSSLAMRRKLLSDPYLRVTVSVTVSPDDLLHEAGPSGWTTKTTTLRGDRGDQGWRDSRRKIGRSEVPKPRYPPYFD